MLVRKTNIHDSKFSLFGIRYSAVDYELATSLIMEKAQNRQSYGVSALAVHGLIEGHRNDHLGHKINQIDLVVPDGQPVRWALNSFYKLDMKERVYGPDLTIEVLKKANELALGVFLYGSTEKTLTALARNIATRFPQVRIAGMHTDRFREATPQEDSHDIEKINASGAHIVLVGRGCPRQEVWVSDHLGKVNAVMLAVGAAFDFHAGLMKQAPKWMQNAGLEWLFRLALEPRRLWKRYAVTNSYFIFLFIKRKLWK